MKNSFLAVTSKAEAERQRGYPGAATAQRAQHGIQALSTKFVE